MLHTIHIRNLALLERAEIRLAEGLTVVSGETGGGKSLLITALKLLRGEKVAGSLVRHGALELLSLDRLADHQQHLIGAKGLGDEVVRAAADGLERCLVIAIGAHHDDERRAALRLVAVEEGEAVHAGHPHIAQDQVGGRGREQLEC